MARIRCLWPAAYCWLQMTMEIARDRVSAEQFPNGAPIHMLLSRYPREIRNPEIHSHALSSRVAVAIANAMVFLVLVAKLAELNFRTGNFFPTLATLSHNQVHTCRMSSGPHSTHRGCTQYLQHSFTGRTACGKTGKTVSMKTKMIHVAAGRVQRTNYNLTQWD